MIDNLPEINFATADVETLQRDAKKLIEQLLGRNIERADPLLLFLNGLITIIVQQRLLIDFAAKMNLLAYSKDDYLDHLGALVGVSRLPASYAVTTCEVKLSAARDVSTIIKKGTRITADNEIYFALDDDVIFTAGEVSKTCSATCTVEGEIGNGFAIGELAKIVDPQAFLLSITNTTATEGGADIESDDSLRERIHEAPEKFSVAGSQGAYIFHAKTASALVSDVAVVSPIPGVVNVYILLQNGEIPGEELLAEIAEYLSGDTIRPLTDQVNVLPAQVVNFDLTCRYWISRENATLAGEIISAAAAATDDYILWQKSELGRDINPDELIQRLKNAGVKRVEITSPAFTVLDDFSVAVAQNVTADFAGIEEK